MYCHLVGFASCISKACWLINRNYIYPAIVCYLLSSWPYMHVYINYIHVNIIVFLWPSGDGASMSPSDTCCDLRSQILIEPKPLEQSRVASSAMCPPYFPTMKVNGPQSSFLCLPNVPFKQQTLLLAISKFIQHHLKKRKKDLYKAQRQV